MIDKNDELLLKNISEINGISGFENEVAAYIKETFADKQAYERLCINSYMRFLDELNWGVSGKRLLEQMKGK